MKNNNIIIIILVVVLLALGGWWFYDNSKKKQTTAAPPATPPENKKKYYSRLPDTEPFSDNFNPDFYSPGTLAIITVDLGNLQNEKGAYTAGFLKGINAAVSARNVTLYQNEIKEYITSPWRMAHWDIRVGELLAPNSANINIHNKGGSA